ncbi:uncharacterized protein LOC142329099 [Lycorma delicatula]|uniref:uncharacterized protein LOC142329099 n=1 Tax=Lycorma delicatula TaxID=130591 RepID=UPI003F5137AA
MASMARVMLKPCGRPEKGCLGFLSGTMPNITEKNETDFWGELETETIINTTVQSKHASPDLESKLYIYLPSVLVTLCLIAVVCNLVILSSACWIRRPISPTLLISLSMTTSDSYTLLISAIGLIINSLIPKGFNKHIPMSQCSLLIIESLRFGSFVTTFFHIFALGGNHYLGIIEPLKYTRLMTHRNIYILVSLLWIIPPIVFRRSVNRSNRNNTGNSSRRGNQSGDNEVSQIRNAKAVCTTILIVGSLLLGWTPALLYFALVCDDCVINRNTYTTKEGNVLITFFCNTLLITKTALNSYIYAARMHEIKIALKRMLGNCLRKCCKICIPNDQELTILNLRVDGSQRRTHCSRYSSQRRTTVCHLSSNSQDQPLINGTSRRNTSNRRHDTSL